MKGISLSDFICYHYKGHALDFSARVAGSLRVKKTRTIPAMAVEAYKGRLTLLCNPDWFEEAEHDFIQAVLAHEIYHVLLEHHARQIEMYALAVSGERKEELATLIPYAIDLAVNTLLRKAYPFVSQKPHLFVLPGQNLFLREMDADGVFTGKYREVPAPWKKWPHDESFEFYLENLVREYNKNREDTEKLKNALKGVLQQVADNHCDDGKGNDDKDEDGESGSSGGGEDEDSESGSSGGGEDEDSESGSSGGGEDEDSKGKSGGPSLYPTLGGHGPDKAEADKGGAIEDALATAEDLREQAKSIQRSLARDMKREEGGNEGSRLRGLIPAGLLEKILQSLEDPKVPWHHILRSQIVTTHRYRTVRSTRRFHRRHAAVEQFLPFPGTQKDRAFTVGFCIDTSASMSAKALERGLNELHHLSKADRDIEVYVIECDADVEKTYRIGLGDEVQYDVAGRGGTSFDPALKKCQELKTDIVFYYTDGYAPAPDSDSRVRCPFFWAITPGGRVPDEGWGQVIWVEDDDDKTY